ncbi:helix-turn-helix domain-containing protein [Pectinatus frisingensis]|uniref:helix-turn-helix domain-containing protein n=1 Tax=Pectinatus frisingensis TaxID=865 RepID=UPI003D803541
MNSRIKLIRKHYNHTQQELGDICGKTRSAIAAYEDGKVIPDDAFIKLLCLKFNINEIWLRTGEGEMFLSEDTNLLHDLAQKHELNKAEEHFMSAFLELNKVERAAMIKCMSLMTREDNEYTVQHTLSNPDTELTTQKKRQLANEEFDAEEKSSNDASSSASTGKNGLYTKMA